jgi:hypothetical protein
MKSALMSGAAAFLAVSVIGGAFFLAADPLEDPCKKAFKMAEQVIAINGVVVATGAEGIKAARADDQPAMDRAASQLDSSANQLDQLQPEYDRAANACLKENQ